MWGLGRRSSSSPISGLALGQTLKIQSVRRVVLSRSSIPTLPLLHPPSSTSSCLLRSRPPFCPPLFIRKNPSLESSQFLQNYRTYTAFGRRAFQFHHPRPNSKFSTRISTTNRGLNSTSFSKSSTIFHNLSRNQIQFYNVLSEASLNTTKSTARRGRRILFGFLLGISIGLGTTLLGNQTWASAIENVEDLSDRIIRFSRAASCAVVIAIDYKMSLRGLSGEERARVIKEVHQRSAEKLLHLFQINRGIYVKAGQHISSLDYILPMEYVKTMVPLHDKAPSCPFEDIIQVFKEDFNSHPDIMFAEFDREPVAAASLAQVHRAVTRSGQEVAVKVQFPQLRRRCDGDVNTIAFLVNAAYKFFPDADFNWLVKEFRANLPKELDFIHEAKNAERAAAAFKNSPEVYVPKIIWEKTSSRILTMEYIHGVKLDDVAALKKLGVSVAKVAALLTKVFSQQIFLDGFVHCDPHPGNILIRKLGGRWGWLTPNEPQLVLLDHGLYRQLNDQFRLNYCRLWKALIEVDEDAIQEYSRLLCGPNASYQLFACILTARAWESRHKLGSQMDESERDKLMSGAAQRFTEINHILAHVPSELLLMLKTNDLLRALNRELGNPINTYLLTVRYCITAITLDELKHGPSLYNRIQIHFDFLRFMAGLAVVDWYLWLSSNCRKIFRMFTAYL
jgi:aarF domain-containing kinase